MHSAPCVLYQFPDATPRKPQLNAGPQLYEVGGPRLDWTARVKSLDPVVSCDVMGHAAFRKAGLCAWAKASPNVRLFVFDPNAESQGGFRYESWLVVEYDLGGMKHLGVPLVGNQWVSSRDVADAMAACERATAAALRAAAGPLL